MSGNAQVLIQAGVIHGDVTVQTSLVGMVEVPLAVAALDYSSVFSGAGVEQFTGREWLLDSIEAAMAANGRASGLYLLVTARAGMGKTTLAAWLSRAWACPQHFTQQVAQGHDPAVALRSITAQLILRYGLEEKFAPNGMLTAWASDPAYFPAVLSAAAQRALQRGETVRIVVDGLDGVAGEGLALGLPHPHQLPPGVVIVATCREGTAPGRLPDGEQVVRLRIDPGDPNNQRDIARFLAVRAGESAIAERLASAGISADEFTRLLAERCEGVWVYLHYVLTRMRAGNWARADLERLPSGLAAYYRQHVTVRRGEPGFATVDRVLLATLAAAGQPLSPEQLVRFTGLDQGTVAHLCDVRYRPFLAVDMDGTTPCYALYHPSLREFLQGDEDPDDPGQDPVERGRMRASAYAAHHRIADQYLAGFGGLHNGLPVLAADLRSSSADNCYALRHLPAHLDAIDRHDELHLLLTCRPLGTDTPLGSVWAEAHERAGTLDALLAGLELARRRAEQLTDEALAVGRSASTLGAEVEYAMLAARLVTRSKMISPDLLEALLRTGNWSTARALAHAHRLDDPPQRAEALTRLLPWLDDTEVVDQTCRDAVRVVLSIDAETQRGEALGKLAPHLDAGQLPTLLTAAGALQDPRGRAAALTGVASCLDSSAREDVVAQALDAVANLHDQRIRAEALVRLVPHLDERGIRKALAIVGSIHAGGERLKALAALTPPLEPHLWRCALQVAADTSDPGDRAVALSRLAEHLQEPERSSTLDQALQLVATIKDGGFRSRALQRLLPHLHDRQLGRVLALAYTVSDELARARTLVALVPRLDQIGLDHLSDFCPTGWPRTLVRVAVLGRHRELSGLDGPSAELDAELRTALRVVPSYCIGDVAQLACFLDRHALDQLMTFMIARGGTIGHHLAEVVPYLNSAQLDRVLEWAGSGKDSWDRYGVVSVAAPYLTPQQLDRAVDVAIAVRDSNPANVNLLWKRLLPWLNRAQLDQVLRATARRGGIASGVATALVSLASRLNDDERHAARDRLLTTLASVPRAEERVMLLADIAEQLQGAERARVVSQCLRRAEAMPGNEHAVREPLLARLAPYLGKDLLDNALRLTANTVTAQTRARMLAILAPYLDADQLDTALETAIAIGRNHTVEEHCAEALTALAPYLRASQLDRALVAAADIQQELIRPSALIGLAPHLRTAQQSRKVHTLAEAITNPGLRAWALAGAARHLPEPDATRALSQAEQAIEDMSDQWYELWPLFGHLRMWPLAGLAEHLPEPARSRMAERMLRVAAAFPNRRAQAEVMTCLAKHGDGPPLDLAVEANQAAAAEFDHHPDQLLVSLAPRLSAPQLDQELIAVAQAHTRAVASTLRVLAPYLSSDQLQRALDHAIDQRDVKERITALTGLTPYLGVTHIGRALEAALALPAATRGNSYEGNFLSVDVLHLYRAIFGRLDALARQAPAEQAVRLLRRLYHTLPPEDVLLSVTAAVAETIDQVSGPGTIAHLARRSLELFG
ncbi:hypothetical protein CLM62_23290 [Streptomyces sp. SA15]|uniref:hypothetical protein n=1 Tax=Streptomyces sp. SA15 TaxID=934019 RepID=UPI000BAF2384|nr:hypothetical protein [Streptomyces sp. SA15]PAZ13622.1 hypothetical protein CLM62_23290 [Streptomyces sp. SA15]